MVFSRQLAEGSSKSPHLSLLHLPKGRGETNAIELTTTQHYQFPEGNALLD
jgi:hypothetical protein